MGLITKHTKAWKGNESKSGEIDNENLARLWHLNDIYTCDVYRLNLSTKESFMKSIITYNKRKPADKWSNTTNLKINSPAKTIYVGESLQNELVHYLARLFANHYNSY